MTLVVRDEEDILRTTLDYHLHQGVDLFIVSDHGSLDSTREILERYARAGHVHVIDRPPGDFPPGKRHLQGAWQTEMARMAATDFDADWVINGDADEFWWPVKGSLKDVFAEVPERFGVLTAPRPDFLPRPDDDRTFIERMTVRQAVSDRRVKQAHRARPDVEVGIGSHDVHAEGLVDVPWWPARILHFPMRDTAQYEKRMRFRAAGLAQSGKNQEWHRAYEEGRLAELFATRAVDDDAVAAGLREGRLVVDERLRDFIATCSDPLEDPSGLPSAEEARTPAEDSPRPAWLTEPGVQEELAEIHLDAVTAMRRRMRDLEGDRRRVEERLADKRRQLARLKEKRAGRRPIGAAAPSAARSLWRRLRAS
jgi:hypothetical protein